MGVKTGECDTKEKISTHNVLDLVINIIKDSNISVDTDASLPYNHKVRLISYISKHRRGHGDPILEDVQQQQPPNSS
ncbi:hypothetical protein CSKR_110622 [Clonorchis sinensis]|uniref:Uncharacterized protein n=1 Tax=Clonorchis sinensis TaxID=79923 RepID=A0A419PFC4_CLOSI|nr:hypothetical protein CSKR_110622 [Clonorchis sinensis]